MKIRFKLAVVCTLLGSCHNADPDPATLKYTVKEHHFINDKWRTNPDSNGFIGKGTNNSVVFYDSDPQATKTCCDGGAFFIAFEIPEGINSFNYTDSLSLSKAHCITGVTGSIAGPMYARQTIGQMSGKKITDNKWEISISIPKTASSFSQEDIFLKENFLIVK